MYRYFLCQGKGNLSKILTWLNFQRQAAGQYPVFNPFDIKIVGEPNEYEDSNPHPVDLRPELEALLSDLPPIIIPFDRPCMPLIVDRIATQKAEGQLVAWGYQVEALEEPRTFQAIQPANARAQELLYKAMESKPNGSAPISGEKAIVSAINGLIQRDKVKPEHLETIENALVNPQIDRNYWESLFKGRGADQAFKQGIYSADMVRLLTLRAMVIPETLPEFLSWISKKGKKEECESVSEKFQGEIRKSLIQVSEQCGNLTSKITQGVKLIIPYLIGKPEILPSVVWLLSSDEGTWRYFYQYQISKDIDDDLKLMSRLVRGKEENLSFKLMDEEPWKEIFTELQDFWRHFSCQLQPQYQVLAILFRELKDYQLSAFFYHVCSGVIPKEIFFQISDRGFYCQIYGVRLIREIGAFEYWYLKIIEIGGLIVPLGWVIILMILSGTLGYAGTLVTTKRPNNNSSQSVPANEKETPSKNDERTNASSISKNQCSDNIVTNPHPESNITDKTQKSIEALINYFVNNCDLEEEKVENEIVNIFKNSQKLDINEIKDKSEIIKEYQKIVNPGKSSDGIIEPEKETFKRLKCDIANALDISLIEMNDKCETSKNKPSGS